MLRKILSFALILSLICAALPAIAEEMDAVSDEEFAYHTLKRGDRDGDDSSEVLTLQNRLIELGYLRSTADGVYGGDTEVAVSSLQRNNEMEETGEATPALQELLFSDADLVTFAESDEPESVTYRVQQKLAQWGFYGGVLDGAKGDDTNSAIDEFRDYLPAYERQHPAPTPAPEAAPTVRSGYADAAVVVDVPLVQEESGTVTDDMLRYIDGELEFDPYRATVQGGDEGQEVDRVQRRLHQLKYLAETTDSYDSNTERAMLYFQKKNDLPLTAVADEATQRVLFSDAAPLGSDDQIRTLSSQMSSSVQEAIREMYTS